MLKTYLIISLSFFLAFAQKSPVLSEQQIAQIKETELTLDDVEKFVEDVVSHADPETFDARNIFEALLPIYGPAKLSRILTQKNLDSIKVEL